MSKEYLQPHLNHDLSFIINLGDNDFIKHRRTSNIMLENQSVNTALPII